MNGTRLRWVVIGLAIGGVLASACQPQPGTGPETGGGKPDVITIAQSTDAVTMDPGKSTQVLTVNFYYNLFDSLTRWDGDLKVVPALATEWKNVDATTWDFTLRQGVKFHDGAALTAEDVKATLDRVRTRERGTIVQSGFATIKDVQVRDSRTIRLVTTAPDPLVPVRMAQMGSQVYPARLAATEEGTQELARRPIGTGAYRFAEWVKDERLVLESNPDWWGWQGKEPPVKRVVWRPIPDEFARVSALQKGEVDLITTVPPDQIRGLESANTKILSAPATRTAVFLMNAMGGALGDKRVRQALHHAIDVPSIVKNLYGGKGKPFSGGLADSDFGYNADLKPYPFDQERARRLLADAAQPNPELTLFAGTGTMVNDKQLLEAVADMWSRVGIRAKVTMLESSQRQKQLNERTTQVNGMLLVNPQSTLLDADGSLWRFFHPNGFGGKFWAGSQPGQPFYQLMEEARSTLDQDRRKQLYREATQIFHDEKPWLELFQEEIVYAAAKRVSFKVRGDMRLIVAEMTFGR